jgi:hypothetical protein
MDLFKLVRELHVERDRLDRVIAAIESMQRETASRAKKSRRGRKAMGPAERRAVSERMRRYWAERRKAAETTGSD